MAWKRQYVVIVCLRWVAIEMTVNQRSVDPHCLRADQIRLDLDEEVQLTVKSFVEALWICMCWQMCLSECGVNATHYFAITEFSSHMKNHIKLYRKEKYILNISDVFLEIKCKTNLQAFLHLSIY